MIVELDHINQVDPANDGKLVYLKGQIKVNEPLTEPEYGVTIPAVKLKRRVQMYQWVEVQDDTFSWWGMTEDKLSSISYVTTWKDKLVDSSLFIKPDGHVNPKSFPVESGVSVSDIVYMGAFTLNKDLKESFNTYTLLTSDQRPERRDIKMHSGLYYHSFDVWNPEVGETRVQLSYAGADDNVVTVLAGQVGSSLQPFFAESKDLSVILEGEHSLSHILASKFPSTGVWLIRIPTYLAVYSAYSKLTVIINMCVGKHGRLVQSFFQTNTALLRHILSSATLFAVLGICWFSYSPFLGFLNLLACLILTTYCIFKVYSLYFHFNR